VSQIVSASNLATAIPVPYRVRGQSQAILRNAVALNHAGLALARAMGVGHPDRKHDMRRLTFEVLQCLDTVHPRQQGQAANGSAKQQR
jgi:hypothetical protein